MLAVAIFSVYKLPRVLCGFAVKQVGPLTPPETCHTSYIWASFCARMKSYGKAFPDTYSFRSILADIVCTAPLLYNFKGSWEGRVEDP